MDKERNKDSSKDNTIPCLNLFKEGGLSKKRPVHLALDYLKEDEFTHSPEDEQSILLETPRPHRLVSEPTLTQKRFTHGCTRKFY